jgi:hypothetical protein
MLLQRESKWVDILTILDLSTLVQRHLRGMTVES